jgi:hypothetical protein
MNGIEVDQTNTHYNKLRINGLKNKAMKRISKILWTIYFLFFCKPRSLRQLKIFCLKIDGLTNEEWGEVERGIMSSPTLRKYFEIKE